MNFTTNDKVIPCEGCGRPVSESETVDGLCKECQNEKQVGEALKELYRRLRGEL